jgi:hypothetical protein
MVDDRNEARVGDGIAAGKQGNVMSLPDQFFRERGNDTLCSSVCNGGHSFKERGDLRYPHLELIVYDFLDVIPKYMHSHPGWQISLRLLFSMQYHHSSLLRLAGKLPALE